MATTSRPMRSGVDICKTQASEAFRNQRVDEWVNRLSVQKLRKTSIVANKRDTNRIDLKQKASTGSQHSRLFWSTHLRADTKPGADVICVDNLYGGTKDNRAHLFSHSLPA